MNLSKLLADNDQRIEHFFLPKIPLPTQGVVVVFLTYPIHRVFLVTHPWMVYVVFGLPGLCFFVVSRIFDNDVPWHIVVCFAFGYDLLLDR